MCGRYYNRRQKQEIAAQLRAKKIFDEPYSPNYNVAPTTFQPIVRQERDTDDRELILARWGLVPYWAKTLAEFKGFSTFNARAETISPRPLGAARSRHVAPSFPSTASSSGRLWEIRRAQRSSPLPSP